VAAGYNRVVMIGNLTRDPDYKQLTSGQPVCQLGLASNRQYRNKQTGAMVQEVCFVDVDVFGPQADSCKQYLQKGRSVLIEGRLKFDSWESPEGQKRSKHSIVADRVVFLSSNAESTDGLQRDEDFQNGNNQVTNELAKEFFGNQKQPELSVTPTKKSKKSGATRVEIDETTSSDELAFQDEPPFQDDLPF
jgi:single-strand DNA-binding protein